MTIPALLFVAVWLIAFYWIGSLVWFSKIRASS